MVNQLWKVTTVKVFGKISKGMFVEIVKSGISAPPTIKEIGDAFNRKYGIVLPTGCSLSNFEIRKA